jgi:GTPase SAR1 family protein
MMRRLVCPYCFEKFTGSQTQFRCLNPNPAQCSLEPDTMLANYQRLNTPPKLGRVFSADGSRWRRRRLGVCSCGVKTSKLICPHCHNDLPSQFGSTDVHTIALIGAKESGKSHYIAVLVNELTNRVGMAFNASLNALDEQTIRRYREDFRRWIYVDKVTIPTTASARQLGSSVRYPLTYRFSIKRRRLFSFDGLRVSSLVFFDTAGEDLKDIDLMSTETKYIANADAIIFLLDPLQIPAVRHQLAQTTALPQEHTDPQDIVGRAAILIRQMRQMNATQKIKTPVALAFSKIDVVRRLFEPGSPVHQASLHNGHFDVVDGEQMSDNMRAYLSQWIGAGFDLFMQHNFENYSYFGVSSLGSQPDTEGHLASGVAPFRVEDPLLWILFKLGIVRGRRRG